MAGRSIRIPDQYRNIGKHPRPFAVHSEGDVSAIKVVAPVTNSQTDVANVQTIHVAVEAWRLEEMNEFAERWNTTVMFGDQEKPTIAVTGGGRESSNSVKYVEVGDLYEGEEVAFGPEIETKPRTPMPEITLYSVSPQSLQVREKPVSDLKLDTVTYASDNPRLVTAARYIDQRRSRGRS